MILTWETLWVSALTSGMFAIKACEWTGLLMERILDQVYTVVKDRFSSVLNIENDSQKENVVCCKKAEDLDRLMFLIKEKITSAKTKKKQSFWP